METFLQMPLSETVTGIKPQIEEIEKTQAQCVKTIRELMAMEDPVNGIAFPAEIHQLRQWKNMLETQKEFCRVRLRRLQMETDGW